MKFMNYGNLCRKNLSEYTNEELIFILDNNEKIELRELAGIVSEVLRRMNQQKPIFEK